MRGSMTTNTGLRRRIAPASAPRGARPADVHPAVLRPSTGGSPLPAPIQARMETALGHDFSNVRVHQGPEPASIGALAFARGSHVHFASGQYRPHSAAGQRILAHELAHVVQQRAGRVRSPGGAVPINDHPALEAEAHAAAAGRAPLSPAAAQTSRAGAQPIQPLLTKKQFASATPGMVWGARGYNDPMLGTLDELLDGYHKLGATPPTTDREHQALSDERLRHLHQIEGHIYRWSDQKKAEPGNRYRNGLTALMDSVQSEHQDRVWDAHTANLRLWTPGKKRRGPWKTSTDKLWDRLRSVSENVQGAGNIKVHPATAERGDDGQPERPAGFQKQVLAMHARLMTTKPGRKLLGKLNSSPSRHPVAVVPRFSEADQSDGAAAAAMNEASAQATPDRSQPKGFRPGAGSGTVVRISPGFKDSKLTNTDAQGNVVPAPAWLVYGHELIHALHNQRGRNRKQVNAADYAMGTAKAHWSNAEEHRTIDTGRTSENVLRMARGLTRRKGHT